MISLSSFIIICYWICAYFRKYCQYRFHILNVVCWGGSGQSTFRLHQFSLCCRKSHALIIVRESVYGPIQLFHNYTISVDRAWQGIMALKCSISHFLSIWTQKSEDGRFDYWFLYTVFFLDGESSTAIFETGQICFFITNVKKGFWLIDLLSVPAMCKEVSVGIGSHTSDPGLRTSLWGRRMTQNLPQAGLLEPSKFPTLSVNPSTATDSQFNLSCLPVRSSSW